MVIVSKKMSSEKRQQLDTAMRNAIERWRDTDKKWVEQFPEDKLPDLHLTKLRNGFMFNSMTRTVNTALPKVERRDVFFTPKGDVITEAGGKETNRWSVEEFIKIFGGN
jgi:hypothetical protein